MAIRISVDLRPFGAGEPETIGILEIGNRDAIGELCDYDYRFAGQRGMACFGSGPGMSCAPTIGGTASGR